MFFEIEQQVLEGFHVVCMYTEIQVREVGHSHLDGWSVQMQELQRTAQVTSTVILLRTYSRDASKHFV